MDSWLLPSLSHQKIFFSFDCPDVIKVVIERLSQSEKYSCQIQRESSTPWLDRARLAVLDKAISCLHLGSQHLEPQPYEGQ